MIELKVEWPEYSRVDEQLRALEEFDPLPLLERWRDIITEGNRRGVLSGLDGHDQPMPVLKYRDGKAKKTGNRKAGNFGTNRHETTGHGPFATGLHDNLTSAQYQELTGPRLAPRREASRVIKNLETEIRYQSDTGLWEVVGAWRAVVSADDFPFLPVHFDGLRAGRGAGFVMPKYDLRPVRPRDIEFAENELRAFCNQLFRGAF